MRLKSYPKMKDSGVEWIGEIPEHWEISSLVQQCKQIQDMDHKMPKKTDSGIPFLSISHIVESNEINFDNTQYISEKDYDQFLKKIKPKKNDILYSRVGTICEARLIREDRKFAFTYNVVIIKPKETLDPLFLFYALNSSIIKEKAKLLAPKTTHPFLGLGDIKKIPIIMPDKKEQLRIGKFLDNIIPKIYLEISKNKNLVKLFKEKKQSLINQAVTKGLDPSAPMKDSGVQEIGKIPEHWKIIKIGKLLQNRSIMKIQDGNHGELHPIGEDFVQEGIPFLTADRIKNGVINFDNCKKLSKEFISKLRIGFAKPDDVILTHKGTLGLVTVIPKNQELVILSPQTTYYRLSKNILKEYFSCNLQSSYLQEQLTMLGRQSTRYYVGIREQRNLILILTENIEEQKEISDFLGKQSSRIDSLILKTKLQIEKLQEYRQSLISSAITGKIAVTGLA